MLYKKCLEEGGFRGAGLWLVCLCGFIAVFTVAAWGIYGKFEVSLRGELWGVCFILGLTGTAVWIALFELPGASGKTTRVANRAVSTSHWRRDLQTHEDLLVEAIRRHNHKGMARLIRRRKQLNEPDANGMTPVMHAVRALNYRAVRMLAKAGADLNAIGPRKKGLLALVQGVPQSKYLEIEQKKLIKFLEAQDAPMSLRERQIAESTKLALANASHEQLPAGPDALRFAAQRGNLRELRALLAVGVDPNEQDGQGQTAAHLAAREGRKKVLCELAANGADFSIEDESGSVVAGAALSSGHDSLSSWLLTLTDEESASH